MQILVANKFIEGYRTGQHAARGIRHVDHVEIGLQTAILSRCPVNRDVGEIKMLFLALLQEAEIVLVDWNLLAISQSDVPFPFFDSRDV